MSTRINFLFLSDNPGTATSRAVAGGAQPGRSRRQKATIKKVAPVPASPWLPQVQAKPSMRNEKPSEERRYNI